MNDGRWVTLKDGRRVLINNYMNDFIRNKGKDKEKEFNKKFKIIEKEDPYEKFNKKGFNISDKGRSVQIKQLDAINKKTGKTVGYVRYNYVNDFNETDLKNKVNVIMINVDEEYKRQGIGTHLYKQLQQIAGNDDIYLDEITPEGKKLIKSIGEVKKEEIVKDYKNRGRKYPEKWWVRIK